VSADEHPVGDQNSVGDLDLTATRDHEVVADSHPVADRQACVVAATGMVIDDRQERTRVNHHIPPDLDQVVPDDQRGRVDDAALAKRGEAMRLRRARRPANEARSLIRA